MAYGTNTLGSGFNLERFKSSLPNLQNNSTNWGKLAQLKQPEFGSIFSSNQMNQNTLQDGLSTGLDYGSMAGPPPEKGTDWKGWGGMIGSGLQGLGQLAQGWAAIKGIGVAEDQLGENKRQYNQNYAQQLRAFEGDRTRANTRIDDQNAWKAAQGRTDLGKLIA